MYQEHSFNSARVGNIKTPTVIIEDHPELAVATDTNWLKRIVLSLSMVVLAAFVIWFIYPEINTNVEADLKTQIKGYFNAVDNGNQSLLDDILSEEIALWYGVESMSRDEVKQKIAAYQQEYQETESIVDWETLNIEERLTGGFDVSHKLFYKFKPRDQREFVSYELNIVSVWDGELKLKEISEKE